MGKNTLLYKTLVLLIVSLGTGCSNSHGGLSGVSGKRSTRTSDTNEMQAEKSMKKQKEPGQDTPSGGSDSPASDNHSSPELSVQNSSTIDVGISFQQWRGDASFTNCVDIAVNGGKSVRLGCNIDGNLSKVIRVLALSRPSVNAVRIIFTTQGKERGTTADGSANTLMRVSKNGNSFRIGYEDLSDGDFNDFIFSVSTDGSVALKIENCEKAECSLQ